MMYYVVADYAQENNSVAYDLHCFTTLEEAKEALNYLDHRGTKIDEWDTERYGPIINRAGQVYYN